MKIEKKENESSDDYLRRLFEEGDKAVKNLHKVKADMKRDGIIGFCKECGGNRYANKKHKCS